MVDAGSYYGEGVVLVCEAEESLTLDVGVCDVDAVEEGWVVVEYA